VCAPALLLPLDGAQSPAGVVLARGLAVLLVAVGLAGWAMPDAAVRAYLWVFGVGVKGLGSVLWGLTAWASGASAIGLGAAVDAAIAVAVVWSLRSGGTPPLEEEVHGHASRQDRHPAQ
jgi:hypothetical protein